MTVLMRELLPSSVKMLILGKVTVIADTGAKGQKSTRIWDGVRIASEDFHP